MQVARKPRLHEVIDAEKATLLHGVMNDPVPWRHVLAIVLIAVLCGLVAATLLAEFYGGPAVPFERRLSLGLIAATAVAGVALVSLALVRRRVRKALIQHLDLFEKVTVQREQKHSLRSRQRLLSDLLEASPDAMLLLDAAGSVRMCNWQAQAMFGHAREDLLRLRIDRLIPCWPLGASIQDLVAMANASRQPEGTGEGVEGRRRDGGDFPVELTVSAFEEEGGQCILVGVRDVLARRYVERCMLELLDQRRAIFANAPPMMFTSNGVFRSVNPAFVALFGASEDDLMGMPTSVLCGSPQAHAAFGARVGPALARGESIREDITMYRFDGSAFEARVAGQAVKMEGHVQAAVWMIEDVSEIRRAEIAMREARERLETAQIAGNVGVWEMDAVSGRNYWTPHLERMFGFEPGQFGGTHDDFVRTLHPDDRKQVLVRAVAMLKSDAHHYREAARIIRLDGTERWLQTEANVYRGADRRVVRMVGVVIDITEQKAAHAEMKRAMDMAEEVAALKSDFLANVSHEIRTPMNAIKGMTHLALRSDLSSQQREYLEKIEQSNQQLMRIINDILDFSSIESGHITLAPVAFELDAMLRTVMDMAGPKALARHLELVCDVAPSVPRQLFGDPLRIGQMLGQLLDNAIKFTDEGEVALVVRGEDSALQGGGDAVRLRFEVRDTGIGLTEPQQQRLYQSFRQVDSSRTRKRGGTGLGLAICKRLAGIMGGDVGVRSKTGYGSTFWLTLALGRTPQAPLPLPPSELSGVRLLVVDDSAHAAQVLADLLVALRFRVKVVHSGKDAVHAVALAEEEADPFGAVLLDWSMPGAGGVETVGGIRALPLARQPALMMLSFDGREDVLSLARSAGIAEFLQKPVQAETVFAAVVRLLERHALADPQDSSLDDLSPAPDAEDPEVKLLLDRLMQRLRDSDATACDIWKQNRRMLRSRFGEQSSMIERAIEDFDFERAAELAATALAEQVASAVGR